MTLGCQFLATEGPKIWFQQFKTFYETVLESFLLYKYDKGMLHRGIYKIFETYQILHILIHCEQNVLGLIYFKPKFVLNKTTRSVNELFHIFKTYGIYDKGQSERFWCLKNLTYHFN